MFSSLKETEVLKLVGRVRLVFRGSGYFPANYNHLLASFIYSVLSDDLREFLHNRGFVLGKRRFKLFVFSRIFGDLSFVRRSGVPFLFLDGEGFFYVSSLWGRFIRDFVEGVLDRGSVRLGEASFDLDFVENVGAPRFSSSVVIRMLSPMVAQRTYVTPGGIKKTRFYSPWEPAFVELLNMNLFNKYMVAVQHKLLPKRNIKRGVKIYPLEVDDIRDKVVFVYGRGTKRKVLEGWTGKYLLRGPKTLIKVGYYAGLLYGNPKGLGMFEVIENDSKY